MVISITFILLTSFVEAMGFGDWLKDKDEPSGGEIEREFQTEASSDSTEPEPEYSAKDNTETSSEPAEEPTSSSQTSEETSSSGSQLGIQELMNKRAKLEEAIDYVGLLIKNLKDKRTKLVKNIEDELVDIGNLKEKLTKINQFISEEKQGLEDLSAKRSRAEKDADEVGSIVYNMRDRIAEIEINKLVIISETLSPIYFPKKPDVIEAIKGRNSNDISILSF